MNQADLDRLSKQAHAVAKPHVRSIMQRVKDEMGPEGEGIDIGEPENATDFAKLGFPSQAVADKFMAKLRERMK